MVKLTKLSDASPFLRTLWYGEPGTGKTTAAAHAAKHGRTVIIDAEGGVMAQALEQFDIDHDNIERYVWCGTDDLTDLSHDLFADPPFAVVVDSASELHDLILAQAQKDRLAGGGRDRHPGISIGDHGVATAWHKAFLRDIRLIDSHVLWTAQEDSTQDEDTGIKSIGPRLPNKMRIALTGCVDQIIRTETRVIDEDEPEWYVGTAVRRGIAAGKDRTSTLPIGIVDPTFDRIWDYFTGTITEDTDTITADYVAAKRKADEAKQARQTAKS